MTTHAELAASILPAIVASIGHDDHLADYTCPVTGDVFDIVSLDPVDLEEDETRRFRVEVVDTIAKRRRTIHDVDTRDAAHQFIADQVAGNLTAAKKTLIDACATLGLKKAA